MASFVSGEETQAVAYQLAPLAPKGFGLAIEWVAISLGIIGLVVISLRAYTRFSGGLGRPWGLDDILAVIGNLAFFAAIVFAAWATRYGLGARDIDLSSPLYQIRASEYVVYWEVSYLVSSSMTKCAIGLACMRLDTRKRYVIPMAINSSVVVVVTVLALIYIFVSCRPLAATWNSSLGTCQETLGQTTFSYLIFMTQLATDWILVFVPSVIVAATRMQLHQKALMTGVLGLGALASISACFRVPYLRYIDIDEYPEDYLYHLGMINLSSNIECGLGAIACSLPPLHRVFRCRNSIYDGKYNYSGEGGIILRSRPSTIKLDLLNRHAGLYHASASRASRGRELDGFDDSSSLKGIIRRTEVRIVSSS